MFRAIGASRLTLVEAIILLEDIRGILGVKTNLCPMLEVTSDA